MPAKFYESNAKSEYGNHHSGFAVACSSVSVERFRSELGFVRRAFDRHHLVLAACFTDAAKRGLKEDFA